MYKFEVGKLINWQNHRFHLFKFQVGENCPYYTDGYTEARLFTNTRNEIEGPGGMFTKQNHDDTR